MVNGGARARAAARERTKEREWWPRRPQSRGNTRNVATTRTHVKRTFIAFDKLWLIVLHIASLMGISRMRDLMRDPVAD